MFLWYQDMAEDPANRLGRMYDCLRLEWSPK